MINLSDTTFSPLPFLKPNVYNFLCPPILKKLMGQGLFVHHLMLPYGGWPSVTLQAIARVFKFIYGAHYRLRVENITNNFLAQVPEPKAQGDLL